VTVSQMEKASPAADSSAAAASHRRDTVLFIGVQGFWRKYSMTPRALSS
jgi:hypothetical protein